MDVSTQKWGVCWPPKMDGEYNGWKFQPYVQIDDLVGFPIIFGNTHL